MDVIVHISPSNRQDIDNEIKSGCWDAIRHRLSSDSATQSFRAEYKNEDGLNAFHLLCANKEAPSDVVRKMAEIDMGYLTEKSRFGEASPLHLAAETGSTLTVKILLDKMCKVWPWNADHTSGDQTWLDEGHRTPLDVLWESRLDPYYELYCGKEMGGNAFQSVTKLIEEMDKVACYNDMSNQMQDFWEMTNYFVLSALTGSSQQSNALPRGKQWFLIHEIVRNGGKREKAFPREVLWFATKLYPDLVKIRDENGDLPLHLAAASCSPGSWGVMKCLVNSKKTSERLKSIYGGCTKTAFGTLLQKFPGAAAVQDKKGRLPLHIVCDNLLAKKMTDLSTQDIQDLLEANPEAPFRHDSLGSLPLHILCKCLSLSDNCIGNRSKEPFDALPSPCDRNKIMKIIIFSQRAAMVRDQEGRLPLHILLAGGTPVRYDVKYEKNKFEYYISSDTAIVEALANMAPDSLDVRDARTRLLPFMMAATGKNSSIDCIYSLLRKRPTNVRGGIVKSAYEHYLEQKVNEMSKERKHLSSRIRCLEREILLLRSHKKKRSRLE